MNSVEISVIARDDQVKRPWLWELSRQFPTRMVLLRANVDSDFANYLIALEGADDDIQRATAWLMTTGMEVESSGRARGA